MSGDYSLAGDVGALANDVELKHLAKARDALSSAFGTEFRFWGWRSDSKATTPVDEREPPLPYDSAEIVADLRILPANVQAAIRKASSPVLLSSDGERQKIAIPLGVFHGRLDGQRIAAVGDIAATDEGLLLRSASLFLDVLNLQKELARSRSDLDVCAEQIGNDFEELTFLRTLADHLDMSDVSQGTWYIAEMVLPLLASVIQSESLILLTAKRDSHAADDAKVDRPVVWVGPHSISREECCLLVELFAEAAQKGAVVQNMFHLTPHGSRFPSVRKLIITALTRNDQVLGWLIAVNHAHRRPSAAETPTEWPMSQFEFGTVEAGLLTSVASMLAIHVRNVELFCEKEDLLVGVVRAMVSAIDAKDPYTCGHSERVAIVAEFLASELGLEERVCEQIYLSALLHDLGKLGVPDAVLQKPGRLTEEEFNQIRPHPERGWAILQDLDQLNYLCPGVLHHHENFDGSGYPDGLRGEDIPLAARILAVADAYDAMVSDRPYRQGMSHEKVEDILRDGAGRQWDPVVVDILLREVSEVRALWNSYKPSSSRQRRERTSTPIKKDGDLAASRLLEERTS
jgi:HD-GYP domain-containing protein (c-di-GMP phosphodiesterase class II)